MTHSLSNSSQVCWADALSGTRSEGNIYTRSSLSHGDKVSVKPESQAQNKYSKKTGYCHSLLITADVLLPKSSGSCLADYSSLLRSCFPSFTVYKPDITTLTVNSTVTAGTRKMTQGCRVRRRTVECNIPVKVEGPWNMAAVQSLSPCSLVIAEVRPFGFLHPPAEANTHK